MDSSSAHKLRKTVPIYTNPETYSICLKLEKRIMVPLSILELAKAWLYKLEKIG